MSRGSGASRERSAGAERRHRVRGREAASSARRRADLAGPMPTGPRPGDGPTGVPGRSAGRTARPGRRSIRLGGGAADAADRRSSLTGLLAEERPSRGGLTPSRWPSGCGAWAAGQFPTHRRRAGPERDGGRGPGLTIELVLSWVDAHHAATGLLAPNPPPVRSGTTRS